MNDEIDDDDQIENLIKICANLSHINQKSKKGDAFEANKESIQKFLYEENPAVFSARNGNSLEFLNVEDVKRSKLTYLVKLSECLVGTESNRKFVACGQIGEDVAGQLMCLIDLIFLPLLNATNGNSTSLKVQSDNTKVILQDLKNYLETLIEERKQRVTLISSKELDKISHLSADGDLRRNKKILLLAENTVKKWNVQITNVLHAKSSVKALDVDPIPGTDPVCGPEAEIQYWSSRNEDLKSFVQQVEKPEVKNVIEALQTLGSPTGIAFSETIELLHKALEEAQVMHRYMKPLQNHYDKIRSTKFCNVKPLVKAMLHVVYLIVSSTSQFWNISKVNTFLEKITDMLIVQAMEYLDFETVFSRDVEEALKDVNCVMELIGELQSMLHDSKLKLMNSISASPASDASTPTSSSIEHFKDRLIIIKDLLKTSSLYSHLEKIVFGGVHGDILNCELAKIFSKFGFVTSTFTSRYSDSQKINSQAFALDYAILAEEIKDIDKQISAVVIQALERSPDIQYFLKIITMFSFLLDRKIIRQHIVETSGMVFELVDKEIESSKFLVRSCKEDVKYRTSFLRHKLGPVASALKWTEEIKSRLLDQLQCLRSILEVLTITENEEEIAIQSKVARLIKYAESFSNDVYTAWTRSEQETCQTGLGVPILSTEGENGEVTVNFNKKIMSIISEVADLKKIGKHGLPPYIMEIYNRRHDIQKSITGVHGFVNVFNNIVGESSEAEFHLMSSSLSSIKDHLKPFETAIYWDNAGLLNMIDNSTSSISSLSEKLSKSRKNFQRIQLEISSWNYNSQKCPMLMAYLDDFGQHKEHIFSSLSTIRKLVYEVLEIFGISSDEPVQAIKFLNGVNGDIAEGINSSIRDILEYFQLGICKGKRNVIFSTQLLLSTEDTSLKYSPPVSNSNCESLLSKFRNFMNELFDIPGHISSFETGNASAVSKTVPIKKELLNMRMEISFGIENTVAQVSKFKDKMNNVSCAWLGSQSEAPDEGAKLSLIESPKIITDFKQQMDAIFEQEDDVSRLSDKQIFDDWFEVDLSEFKNQGDRTLKARKESSKLKILNAVSECLTQVENFINDKEKSMELHLAQKDNTDLMTVLKDLGAFRERKISYEFAFESLKSALNVLNRYGYPLSDEELALIQELPIRWKNLTKLSSELKQKISSLQALEVLRIKQLNSKFEVDQWKFRAEFLNCQAFSPQCANPFDVTTEMDCKLKEAEDEMKHLVKLSSLFDVSTPDFKHLEHCRKELVLLNSLWEFILSFRKSFNDWNAVLWIEVNVDEMERDCRRFQKDLKSMNKIINEWELFLSVEQDIGNMGKLLRVIIDLQNPAMRDRHWRQLMETLNVDFCVDHKTNVGKLFAINLHENNELAKNVVEQSVREMGMENFMSKLTQIWNNMLFHQETHPRTNYTLLSCHQSLVDTLEDNQVQLQTMVTSKYADYFREEIITWQEKLSMADQFIGLWSSVQQKWSDLEGVFMKCQDIKVKLPEETVKFVSLDAELKRVMDSLKDAPNFISAIAAPGLFDTLENLEEQLGVCEKALLSYLETKKITFPRFYFLSNTDMLDIIANGSQPNDLIKHLTNLFASVGKLDVFTDQGQMILKGVYSKEGEYFKFKNSFVMDGLVENWLNQVLEELKNTLKHNFQMAMGSVEDKSRDQWLLSFPVQVSVCASRILWVSEVNMAFRRLQEGYENALKDLNKKQVKMIDSVVKLLRREISVHDRQKLQTICTIDVHTRDVVSELIKNKVDNSSSFAWRSQLRHNWDEDLQECFVDICDASFKYSYEYLGNCSHLVITPLTERCYMTLTQSLHLVMGAAPSGPAGTGKTETTKDLGKALGIMVYIFNCSEQMDFRSCESIHKGLAQSGTWGCFDEFNRMSVHVLSVVAVQVKCILDGLKEKKERLNFMGDDIKLSPTVGIFVTMNPNYSGRTELPENLKALFRPCSMVVPNFELICEIMLVIEGFTSARPLAKKIVKLYHLCQELVSNQHHYDWGLRAMKLVMVVAGAWRKKATDSDEEMILMKSVIDCNLPRMIANDIPLFMGVVKDLFPGLETEESEEQPMVECIKEAAAELMLQADEYFIKKVLQLDNILAVKHSVFVVGPTGIGKSQVCRTLFKVYQKLDRNPVWHDLNPKAVTNDELFGIICPATREWKDGLFSKIMRDVANLKGKEPKWIVLDGDIDPMWIESLNTVMDDNKMLTLASNERISLNDSVRLLFETSSLQNATPATVSRAAILYLNASDSGWNQYVMSWIEAKHAHSERANLIILFDRYVPVCLEIMKTKFKKAAPIADINHVQTLCRLLEALVSSNHSNEECPKELHELYFVFAAIWAFGSALYRDQLVDYRTEFSKWWISEFKTVKFPSNGTVFDFFVDASSAKFVHWSEMVPCLEKIDFNVPLQNLLVPTTETISIHYLMDQLMDNGHPVLLVGSAGCGKSLIVSHKLKSKADFYSSTCIPLNFYSTSSSLQASMEKCLDKKAGKKYGPKDSKKLVYFIDDLNMPQSDEFGSVQSHALLRQHLDYGHWYDRNKLLLKEIENCQYVACMNPMAGTFTIDQRLQRYFTVLSVGFPGSENMQTIFNSVLSHHMEAKSFHESVMKISAEVVNMAVLLHSRVYRTFLPTIDNFHYAFNLRDMSGIFQGLLLSPPEYIQDNQSFVNLFMHEASRVYKDKMNCDKDAQYFDKLLLEVVKKYYSEFDTESTSDAQPPYFHYAKGIGRKSYQQVASLEDLTNNLNEALEQYNESSATMNLVLFRDAILNVCRINRILELERRHCLLIGFGGSGKQSLAKLAAFISDYKVFQIQPNKAYGITELKADLAGLFMRCGMKKIAYVLILADKHIVDEKFLIVINDFLASDKLPDIFTSDQVDEIITSVRNELKNDNVELSSSQCWQQFVHRVHKLLKIVLCFSPAGSTLRNRCRKFPTLMNSTSIIWFQKWPEEALVSVSNHVLSEFDVLPQEYRNVAAVFLSYAHKVVDETSLKLLSIERRYTYVTPKSFLQLLELFKSLLTKQKLEIKSNMQRLKLGLARLQETEHKVGELQSKLGNQEQVLIQKNQDTDELIEIIKLETERIMEEKSIAAEEEQKVAVIAQEVAIKHKDCQDDLAAAEPALEEAHRALNTLNRGNLTELRSFGTPPTAVINVTAAVMILLSAKGRIPKDRSWKASKVMMSKVDSFLQSLIDFDKENIPETCLKALQPYTRSSEFNPEFIKSKSLAAAGLCSWVINIIKFHKIFLEVKPKRQALDDTNEELNAAQTKLTKITKKIGELQDELQRTTNSLTEAQTSKQECQDETELTTRMIESAKKIINGLASEKIRWREGMQRLNERENALCGDVLLVSAFVAYAGNFTYALRNELMDNAWKPFLQTHPESLTFSKDIDVLQTICDQTDRAVWSNEGLPTDSLSIQNAIILTNTSLWPLIIDPQLQALKWLKNRFSNDKNFRVIHFGQPGLIKALETAVSEGHTVLIENIGEQIDASIVALLEKNTVNVKQDKILRIIDKEVVYNDDFRLILHTRLSNPYYGPEIQAQANLINFVVTNEGLEDQLLVRVVYNERPDLQALKDDLTKQQNDFKIKLKALENSLLDCLSNAEGNFLKDNRLVDNLENTKETVAEIKCKAQATQEAEIEINSSRNVYRSVAKTASVLYFTLKDLSKINHLYQFSLKIFFLIFDKATKTAAKCDTLDARVAKLTLSVLHCIYEQTTRGLFEKDRIIFAAQMSFQLLMMKGEIQLPELEFLMQFPTEMDTVSPVEFIPDYNWGAIKVLSGMTSFKNLDRDILGSVKRWFKIMQSDCPEKETFPQEWKNISALQKLCILRCLRSDRMIEAVRLFIENQLGPKFVQDVTINIKELLQETSPEAPLLMIISPGVDLLREVQTAAQNLGYSTENDNYFYVSLGQDQELIAQRVVLKARLEGHCVLLQNVHLAKEWLGTLEEIIVSNDGSKVHEDFKLIMTTEPTRSFDREPLPTSLVELCVTVTNEPPTGLKANLQQTLQSIQLEMIETANRDSDFKAMLFSLCFFHAVVVERRRYGPQGWNEVYNFGKNDLAICVNILKNYMDENNRMEWEDLRYLFGEIIYGGHITDFFDRRLCNAYLNQYLNSKVISGELQLAPGIICPHYTEYSAYEQYIEDLPKESPSLYRLSPNADITSRAAKSQEFMTTLQCLQINELNFTENNASNRQEKTRQMMEELLEKNPEEFNMMEIRNRADASVPYTAVAIRECDLMNTLVSTIRQSLNLLNMALKGEISMSCEMEKLAECLSTNKVPLSWQKIAYSSNLTLISWFTDLLQKYKFLETWIKDFNLPACVWLGAFFNPKAILTAIMQTCSKKTDIPLNMIYLQCDVMKKSKEDILSSTSKTLPINGLYFYGLYMQGAKWDIDSGLMVEAPKDEVYKEMPVVFVRAVQMERQDGTSPSSNALYECPVYRTTSRSSADYIWTFKLKTKERPIKWILAGVALCLQI